MSQIKIGWAKREISLDQPMSLPGQMHMRISKKILDPMYVTALCLEKDGECVIFLSGDLLSPMGMETVPELVQQQNPEIKPEFILPNGTHAHTGGARRKTPETTPDGKSVYSGEVYRDFVNQQAADAICEAWENRKEGGVSYGYGYAVVGHQRRSVYFDDTSLRQTANPVAPNGHGIMYGKTNDPMFSHYETGADHFVNAMFTYDAQGKLTGILVNVPCPSQTSEMFSMQTADYWHDVRVAVAAEFGEDVFVLPQCAAAGDTSPRILHYLKAQERRLRLKYGIEKGETLEEHRYNKAMGERKDIAERILEALKDIYSWSKKEILTDPALHHKMELVPIRRRMITEEEAQWCRDNIAAMEQRIPERGEATDEQYRKAVSTYNAIKNRNTSALDRYAHQEENSILNTVVHVVQVGEVAFASNRFELYQDYMHRIQARSPFIQTFVVQLASFEGGTYLATQRGVENKGYSASLFCNIVGPEGGHELVEHTLRMLEEIKE